MTGSDVFIPVFLALTTGDLSRQYLLTENGGFSPRLSPKPGVLARRGRHPARYSPKPPGSRHGRAHPGGEELEESTNPGLKGDPHLDESKMKKKNPKWIKKQQCGHYHSVTIGQYHFVAEYLKRRTGFLFLLE